MNTMHGALASPAGTGRVLGRADADEHSTNSESLKLKNGTCASPATARASSVLPVPGVPRAGRPWGSVHRDSVYCAGSSGFDDLLQLVSAFGDTRGHPKTAP